MPDLLADSGRADQGSYRKGLTVVARDRVPIPGALCALNSKLVTPDTLVHRKQLLNKCQEEFETGAAAMEAVEARERAEQARTQEEREQDQAEVNPPPHSLFLPSLLLKDPSLTCTHLNCTHLTCSKRNACASSYRIHCCIDCSIHVDGMVFVI